MEQPLKKEPFDYAIFFDNEQKNIDSIESIFGINNFFRCIKIIGLDEAKYKIEKEKQNKQIVTDDLIEYNKNYETEINNKTETNNKYLNLLKEDQNFPIYDKTSGIEEVPHILDCIKWTLTISDKKNAVAIFDWDRTLTVFEELLLPDNLEDLEYFKTNNIFEDTLIYLFGGKDRLEQIRTMFDFLDRNNISIYILTNNPAANETHTMNPAWIELLNVLFTVNDKSSTYNMKIKLLQKLTKLDNKNDKSKTYSNTIKILLKGIQKIYNRTPKSTYINIKYISVCSSDTRDKGNKGNKGITLSLLPEFQTLLNAKKGGNRQIRAKKTKSRTIKSRKIKSRKTKSRKTKSRKTKYKI